jgi:acyl-CoA thioesterase I
LRTLTVRKFSLLIVLFVSLVAASAAAADLHGTGPIHVVVIGSSSAAGKNLDEPQYGGAPGNQTWSQLFQARLNAIRPGSRVDNLALPGTTSFEGMPTGTQNPQGFPAPDPAHNITAALAAGADLVIVAYQLGNGASTLQIARNLAAIWAAGAAAGVPVWVGTPLPRPSTTAPTELAQIVQLRSAILVNFPRDALDFWAQLALTNGDPDPTLFLTNDPHPNQAGHFALAQLVSTTAHVGAPTALPLPPVAGALSALMLLMTGGLLLSQGVRRRTKDAVSCVQVR